VGEWRKRRRDRGATYRWALEHVEAIAIDLLRWPGYIGGGPQGGYKTRSGKHYCAQNGTRWEGLSVTLENNLDGKGKGMYRVGMPGKKGEYLMGDLFGLVILVKGLSNRDEAAEWIEFPGAGREPGVPGGRGEPGSRRSRASI
jgi:hypothetical protein